MTGDEPTVWPRNGVVAGVPFVALPPTAVDAPARDGLVVAWHAFDPPRTAAALAAAVPMTGVPVWRVYLSPPVPDPAEHDYLEVLGAFADQAVAGLPAVLAGLRDLLGVGDGAVGLAGHGEGAAAVLLALAEHRVPVAAAALIAPIFNPVRAVQVREQRFGPYTWSDGTRAVAQRLDATARAAEIARTDPRLLLVGGGTDVLVPAPEVAGLRDVLAETGVSVAEAVTFRMGHALAAEPGLEPCAPITAAVSVDAALTDWFNRHLVPHSPGRPRAVAAHSS